MQTLILAAGRGTRLAPLTDSMPKVMVQVAGQPLIERIVRQCVQNGLTELGLVVGYQQATVRAHLGDGSAFGARITYIEQTELGGTGHAIRTAVPWLRADFMLIFGDSLIDASMIARVKAAPTIGAIGVARVADPKRYGIVSVDANGMVTDLIEKPENPPSNLAIMAMYKMPYAVLAALQGVGKSVRGEIETPDAVRVLLRQGVPFSAVDITGVMDIGTLPDLEQANKTVQAVA